MARAKCPICKRPIHEGAQGGGAQGDGAQGDGARGDGARGDGARGDGARGDDAKGAARAKTPGGKDPFPFCSTRCKLVDLGAWLDGTYRVAGEPIAEPDDEVLARLTSRDGGDA